jgi:hypothetical protein
MPAAVIVTLTDLEARGVHVRLLADRMLGVAPCELVTPEHLVFLWRHRDVVVAAVSYIDRMVPC